MSLPTTSHNPTIPPGNTVPPNATPSLPTTHHSSLLTTPTTTSSVPSVEDFTNDFPTQLTPIVGELTYTTLKTIKDQLKANASSIPTTLGGGNHGYLGLILSPATYATISPTALIEPANTSAIIGQSLQLSRTNFSVPSKTSMSESFAIVTLAT